MPDWLIIVSKPLFAECGALVVQNNVQKRTVYLKPVLAIIEEA